MQFDDNHIAIRERDLLDVLDLSLRVCRAYAGPLSRALAIGAIPAMLINAWLLSDLADFDIQWGTPFQYVFWMIVLVVWELPLVTAPMTLYLGRALFGDRPRPGEIAREFVRALPQMLLFQGILRAMLILPITWIFLFAVWPYLSEVILLERNPIRAGRSRRMTTWRRRKHLHEGYVAELFARWLGSATAAVLLCLAVWGSITMAAGTLVNDWQWHDTVFTVFAPLAMWVVVGYFAVVRFLGYLDLRIRREGWEVELSMRAEKTRLTRQLA
ncbi:MAG TPA: hypothetical protein VE890_18605 [Thermoguttaceae bacterium]|nr:hypothetical protein [Thermoguttaceae bacterium]